MILREITITIINLILALKSYKVLKNLPLDILSQIKLMYMFAWINEVVFI